MAPHDNVGRWFDRRAGIWLLWTFGSALGGILGYLSLFVPNQSILRPIVVGLCEGAIQGAIFSHYPGSRARRWVLVAGIGWPVSVIIGFVAGVYGFVGFGMLQAVLMRIVGEHALRGIADPLKAVATGYLLPGLLVAVAGAIGAIVYGRLQWSSIERPGYRQRNWPAAHAVSGIVLGIVFIPVFDAGSLSNALSPLEGAILGGSI